jgi:glyoxylase-like metal-dependent hydrolase (beta-lactamase superfamily II)
MITNKSHAGIFGALRLLFFLMGAAALVSSQAGDRVQQLQNSAPRNPNASGSVHVLPVRDRVYMLVGAGANITVQVGDENLFVVDTGSPQSSGEVLAAIRTISNKPILFIADTSADNDHVGGNASISKAGWALPDENGVISDLGLSLPPGASIVAHLNVLNRMSSPASPASKEAPAPSAAWPGLTYETVDLKLYNSEPIIVHHMPAAHTDGDSIVFFRGSDVVSTGDIFAPVHYPVIEVEKGGSVKGLIDALNGIIDLLVPKEYEEGGTVVVPGHGRLCDRSEVTNYRDMVTIIRDRIQAMLKKGMTLDQVKAAKPTLDYDGIYGADTGPWTTTMFIETVYRELSKDNGAEEPKAVREGSGR